MLPFTLYAKPEEPRNDYLSAVIERKAFERQHTIDHPVYGRVIELPTREIANRYMELLDEEERQRTLLTPALTTAEP